MEAFGLDSNTLTDAERRPQMGQINRPVPRDPTGRLSPPSSAQLRVPGVQASSSSAGYAEVYDHRQPRLPAGMRGNDTASGSMTTPQEQVRRDVPLGPTPRVPQMNQMSSRSTVQPRRDEREADEEIISDVGIASYRSNGQRETGQSQQELHPRAEAEADDEYEVPLSVPSKYMNIEKNIYMEIDDMEMETPEAQDMDEDDIYNDTEL